MFNVNVMVALKNIEHPQHAARTCLISLTVAVLLTPNNLYKSCSAAVTNRQPAIMTRAKIMTNKMLLLGRLVVLEHQSWAGRRLMPPRCRLLDIIGVRFSPAGRKLAAALRAMYVHGLFLLHLAFFFFGETFHREDRDLSKMAPRRTMTDVNRTASRFFRAPRLGHRPFAISSTSYCWN